MRILFLGPAPECRGFTLAGVAAEMCDSDSSATAALALARKPDSGIGLVLLSPTFAHCLAEDRAFRGLETLPVVLVVPTLKRPGEAPPEDPP